MAKDDEEKEAEAKGGGSKKIIIILVPVILLVVAAGWFLFLKPKSSGAAKALPAPKAGVVDTLDAVSINLAAGHYLKLGLALQPTASTKAVDGSEALDLAISEFSGKSMAYLSTAAGRTAAKEELVARIKLAYLPAGTEESQGVAPDGSVDSKLKTPSQLSAAQAIKLANALTVQPEVYDVYFTTFVMQ